MTRCQPAELLSVDRLTEIARARYETGAYADVHLAMRRDDLDQLPRPPVNPPWSGATGGGLAALTGIPVTIDNGLPSGWCQLRDNATDAI